MTILQYDAKIETTLTYEQDGVTIFETDATLCIEYNYDADDDFFTPYVMAIRIEKTRDEWDETKREGKSTVLASTTISHSLGDLFQVLHRAIDWNHVNEKLAEHHYERHGYPKSADEEHRAAYHAAVM